MQPVREKLLSLLRVFKRTSLDLVHYIRDASDYMSATYLLGMPISVDNHGAQIRKLIHAIEVAHLYENGRHARALGVASQLCLLIEKCSKEVVLQELLDEARATLKIFCERTAVPNEQLIAAGLSQYLKQSCLEKNYSPTTVLLSSESLKGLSEEFYAELVRCRRSVRNLNGKLVSKETIGMAIEDAAYAPSACNRQPCRVLDVTDTKKKQELLKIQNNEAGWRESAGILLIVNNRSHYEGAREYHAAYVDGGLFAMSVMYGLTVRGVHTCPLNMNVTFDGLSDVRKLLGLKQGEVPIMIIAYGYPEGDVLVPRRKTKSLTKLYFQI